jgi:hypothetical protein
MRKDSLSFLINFRKMREKAERMYASDGALRGRGGCETGALDELD